MNRKDQTKRIIAGVFLFFSIALIVGVVFTIGLQKGFTEPKFKMSILFRKVGGLMVGAPVRLSGVTVGTVYDIKFLDEEVLGRGVKVVVQIFAKYKGQVHKTIGIAVDTEGVLGQKIVEISTSPEAYLEDLGHPFIGEDPIEAGDLAETFGSTADALAQTAEKIELVVDEVEDISRTTKRLLQRIEQRVIDGNLFKVF